MIDAGEFANQFLKHVRSCPSGRIACGFGTAFESWFRVELAMMIVMLDSFDRLGFGYTYPGSKEKADLVVESEEHRIVFELKSFVRRADAQKLKVWPQQDRLHRLITEGHAQQGVAIATFFGYGKETLSHLFSKFYLSPWVVAGPYRFYDEEETPLQFMLATIDGKQTEIHV